MGNSRKDYSDYIRFYLITEDSPAFLVENVIGWNEFGLDSARNMEYHGTLNKVTKTLGFTKEARSFILDEYNIVIFYNCISISFNYYRSYNS